jgi:hypothetical protein
MDGIEPWNRSPKGHDHTHEFDADKDGKLGKDELTKWAEGFGRAFGGGGRAPAQAAPRDLAGPNVLNHS